MNVESQKLLLTPLINRFNIPCQYQVIFSSVVNLTIVNKKNNWTQLHSEIRVIDVEKEKDLKQILAGLHKEPTYSY